MAKSKRNSGFYAQAGLIGNALATAKKPASTTDAVHQAIALGKKNRKEKTESRTQKTYSRNQKTESKQQTTSNKTQTANSKQQTEGNKKQAANRKQKT